MNLDDLDDPTYCAKRGDLLDTVARAAADASDEDGAEFVASTATVDRMGDIVEQKWQLKQFRRNPVILHEHAAPVVGRGTASIRKTADGADYLHLSVKWDRGEHNPVGTLVAVQHARGIRSAVSVGFRPGKSINRMDLPEDDPRRVTDAQYRWLAGYVHKQPELLEVSSVAIPANPDALQLRSWYARSADPEADPTDPERLRAYLAEIATREAAGWILSAVRSDEQIRAAIRSILLEHEPDFLSTLGIR